MRQASRCQRRRGEGRGRLVRATPGAREEGPRGTAWRGPHGEGREGGERTWPPRRDSTAAFESATRPPTPGPATHAAPSRGPPGAAAAAHSATAGGTSTAAPAPSAAAPSSPIPPRAPAPPRPRPRARGDRPLGHPPPAPGPAVPPPCRVPPGREERTGGERREGGTGRGGGNGEGRTPPDSPSSSFRVHRTR